MAEQSRAGAERFERERGDFSTDMLLSERDSGDLALMERFAGWRPLDAAHFGGWDEAGMLFGLESDETGAAGQALNAFDPEEGDE